MSGNIKKPTPALYYLILYLLICLFFFQMLAHQPLYLDEIIVTIEGAPSLKLSQFHHLYCQTQTKTAKNNSSRSYSTIARFVAPQTFLLPEVLVRDLSMQQLLRYSRSIRFFAIIFHPFLVFIAPRSVSRAASVQCILIKKFCKAVVLEPQCIVQGRTADNLAN